MANFEAVTASSVAKIAIGMEQKVNDLVGKYSWGDLEYIVTRETENIHATIRIHGYGWLHVYDSDDADASYDFLLQLSQLLDEPMVINSIGHTATSYPLSAIEAKVTPDGRIRYNQFNFSTFKGER